MENGFPDAFAMPSGMGGSFAAYSALSALGSTRFIEGPDGTRVMFYERSNAVDESVSDVASRMTFAGHFTISDPASPLKSGTRADGGLGADFQEEGDPVAAWVWLKQPAGDEDRKKLEAFFDATFGEDGLRMDIAPEAFLNFADSNSWDADLEDEDEPLFE